MIGARLSDAARVVGGELVGADRAFRGVAIDSRRLPRDALFVALDGARVDGHDFVGAAFAAGAAGAIVTRTLDDAAGATIAVDSAEAALAALACDWRAGLAARVVGVTGSNGKTTTKTLIASILARVGATEASAGNLNNELGVPLSVLALSPTSRFAVLEMGCGKPGDIAYLAAIGGPHVGVVTNVGPAHLERLGTLDDVARTKAELYDALPADGVAILNADDRYCPFFAERIGDRRSVRFALDSDADVSARAITLGETTRFTLCLPDGEVAVTLPLEGRHNVANALAAAAAAHALGASPAAIAEGLALAPKVAGRLVRRRVGAGVLIDDSYNANPASVKAAIDALVVTPGRTVLALGDMRELGADERALHAEVGRYAKARGVSALFVVGELAAEAGAAFGAGAIHFSDRTALADALTVALAAGVRALVKGSRSSAMDEVIARVLEGTALGSHGGSDGAV